LLIERSELIAEADWIAAPSFDNPLAHIRSTV
jgi:hypothetical protein